MSGTDALVGDAKRQDVERLLKGLEDGCSRSTKDKADLLGIMTQLKVYGRDPKDAEPVYCKEGISILASYGFASPTPTSREALRCIANALLLAPTLRQDFIDLDLLPKAAERLNSEDYDDEFLVSRIIFLLTYGTNLNQDELLRRLSVASSINTLLMRHALAYEMCEDKSPPSGMATMALSETLKLLFNLSAHQDNAILFQPAIKSILLILNHIEFPSRCLDPPTSLLINALVNLDLGHIEGANSDEESSLSQAEARTLVGKLVGLLERSQRLYKEAELEVSLPPLLTVLRKVYDLGREDLKTHMQDALLPLHEKRDLPIGKSDTLPSRLLRLSSSAMVPNLREIIPALMFELSDQDPKKFIENIGYGFAAGFLASHNIAIPENARQTQTRSRAEEDRPPINPITGQRLDKEPKDDGPPMTIKEKEREAERLFVLFERLKATGVVNVQNPVHQALNDGKLESRIKEVNDSD